MAINMQMTTLQANPRYPANDRYIKQQAFPWGSCCWHAKSCELLKSDAQG